MIDNMPQQNSPSQSSEAGVLIPVWKAGERDEGKRILFNKLSLCIRTVRPDKNKGGRKHGADIGERTLGQQAVGQREGKKAKREDMGKTKSRNVKGWKKEMWSWEWKSIACGKTLKPVHVKTRFLDQ